MNIDEVTEELGVLQLSDSFFPTGLFATSNGLEFLFLDKQITSAQELLEFNRVFIEQQIGPCDCVAVANVYDYIESLEYDKITEVDSICCSLRNIKETRDASIRSGNQLIRCVREFQKDDKILDWYNEEIKKGKMSGIYPISFAICCKALGIKKEKALLMLVYGFVTSTVGASLRLGLIQHFEGQKIIHNLKPLIAKEVKENSSKTIDEIWQFCPQLEINQMVHETMDSKMFIT